MQDSTSDALVWHATYLYRRGLRSPYALQVRLTWTSRVKSSYARECLARVPTRVNTGSVSHADEVQAKQKARALTLARHINHHIHIDVHSICLVDIHPELMIWPSPNILPKVVQDK